MVTTQVRYKSNFMSTQSKKSAEVVVPRHDVEGRAKLINQRLDPQYIVGFVDGEGCFSVSHNKHSTLKFRMEIRPEFEIELREDDAEILYRIQVTLGCGTVYRLEYKRYDWAAHYKFRVGRIKELQEIIVPFFEKYPLQAKKKEVFKYFKQIVEMTYHKEHLTYAGAKKILKIREKMRAYSKKHYKNR